MKRWVVRPDATPRVTDVLLAMGEPASAIADGRVFLGRTRVSADREVAPGDEVTVHEARATAARVSVLHFDGGLLVADKPASVPTIADHRGHEGSLLSLVAREVGLDPRELHPTSRLDRGVSGVVVFATDERARAHLSDARERGDYGRRYAAVTTSTTLADSGEWRAPIGRHPRDARLRAARGKDAVPAETRWFVAARGPRASLLGVTPVTGRTHQIRVHASDAKAPLLGDSAYGGSARVTSSTGAITSLERVALHCAWVRVPAPHGGEPLTFRSDVPAELRAAWRALGGDDEAWARALA